MIDTELLTILVCPETKQPVVPAAAELLSRINEKIRRGAAKNRVGGTVESEIDAGLMTADGRFVYPIRNDIPVMLSEQAIVIDAD